MPLLQGLGRNTPFALFLISLSDLGIRWWFIRRVEILGEGLGVEGTMVDDDEAILSS